MQQLPMEVRALDVVGIDEGEAADAGGRERFGGRASERSDADDEDGGAREAAGRRLTHHVRPRMAHHGGPQ
jgi:hypothetical protein